MRPSVLIKGDTLYWTIRVYDPSDAVTLIDADSTPTVEVRKNGASIAASVTVTKRTATTGIYDCSYNPAAEVEGDQFTIEEAVTIGTLIYDNQFSVLVKDPERGTDSASTFDHATDEVTTNAASRTASQADLTTVLSHLPSSGRAASTTDLTTAQTAIVSACATATGFAVPGDEMALTAATISSVAGAVDVALINQADGADLIGAIADEIAENWIASDASPLAIIAALKADATYTTLIADAASGKTAAELIVGRVTEARAAKLDRDLAAVGDEVNLADNAISASKFDESTAFPLKLDDSGATQVARTGNDGDTLETLSDEIAAIEGGGGGSCEFSGARAITAVVKDEEDNPVVGAVVRITLGAESYQYTTDANGQIVTLSGSQLTLDDHSYDVSVTLRGYTGASATFDVDTDTTSFDSIVLTSNTPSPPDDADLITVYTYFYLAGTPVEGAEFSAELTADNQVRTGAALSKAVMSATTDSDGYAELQLLRAATITKGSKKHRIRIKDDDHTHIDITVELPDQSSVSLDTLVP